MAASATQKSNFIARVAPIAVDQAKKHGRKLFASVAIAQAIQESGWGTSAKMVNANALFGVKVGKSAWKFGTAWKGKAYKTGTTEYYDGVHPEKIVDYFRAYDNISDATEDYMDLLCTAKRYKSALNQINPQRSIEEIVKGGYATGPDYAKHICQLIKTYNLEKYDGKDIPVNDNPYKLTTSLLKKGSRGESVKWLQYELNRYGVGLKVDGILGPKSEQAIKDYQKANKLVVDGKAGPVTLLSLKK